MSSDEQIVVIPVAWNGQHWIGSIPAMGIYVHGRTLAKVEASGQGAVTLIGDGAAVQVKAAPQTPEIAALDAARDRYRTGLRAAVRALSISGVGPRDVAAACQVKLAEAQSMLQDVGEHEPTRHTQSTATGQHGIQ